MIIEDIQNVMTFPTYVIYLIIKIIRSLMKKLNLVIMGFKKGNKGDELILRRSSMKLPYCPLGENLDFKF